MPVLYTLGKCPSRGWRIKATFRTIEFQRCGGKETLRVLDVIHIAYILACQIHQSPWNQGVSLIKESRHGVSVD